MSRRTLIDRNIKIYWPQGNPTVNYEPEAEAYFSRVEADGGVVSDKDWTNYVIAKLKEAGVFSRVRLLVSQEFGSKSGTKLYNVVNNGDFTTLNGQSATVGAFNGFPALDFDGVDDCFLGTLTDGVDMASMSWFGCLEFGLGSDNCYIGSYENDTDATARSFSVDKYGADYLQATRGLGNGSTIDYNASSILNTVDPRIHVAMKPGNVMKATSNGVVFDGSNAAEDRNNPNATRFVIGTTSIADSTFKRAFADRAMFHMILEGAATDTEETAVMNLMGERYVTSPGVQPVTPTQNAGQGRGIPAGGGSGGPANPSLEGAPYAVIEDTVRNQVFVHPVDGYRIDQHEYSFDGGTTWTGMTSYMIPVTVAVAQGSLKIRVAAVGGNPASNAYTGAKTFVASAMSFEGPKVITVGGTYTFNARSTDPMIPAVDVTTTEAVTFLDCNIEHAGRGINYSYYGSPGKNGNYTGCRITMRGTRLVGLPIPNGVTLSEARKAVVIEHFYNVDIQGCYIESAGGVQVLGNYMGEGTVKIKHNFVYEISSAVNNKMLYSQGYQRVSTNFVKLDNYKQAQQVPNAEIAWNFVMNPIGLADVEDIVSVSCFQGPTSSPVLVHHNCFRGATYRDYQYNDPTPGGVYFSGGGILVESPGANATTCAKNVNVYDNIMIDSANYHFGCASGINIHFDDNTAVAKSFPDKVDFDRWGGVDGGEFKGSTGTNYFNDSYYNIGQAGTTHFNNMEMGVVKKQRFTEGYARHDIHYEGGAVKVYQTNPSYLPDPPEIGEVEVNAVQSRFWDSAIAAGLSIGPVAISAPVAPDPEPDPEPEPTTPMYASFNGTTGNIELPDDEMDWSNGWCVEMWAYKPSGATTPATLFHMGVPGTSSNGISIINDNSSFMTFRMYDTSVKAGLSSTNAGFNQLPTNAWVHWAISQDAAGLSTIMKNGVVLKTFDHGRPANILREACALGYNPSSAAEYAGWGVDGVMVWNKPRTAAEVQVDMVGYDTPQAGLVRYHKLDGNANDSSGNAKHGTASASVTYIDRV